MPKLGLCEKCGRAGGYATSEKAKSCARCENSSGKTVSQTVEVKATPRAKSPARTTKKK